MVEGHGMQGLMERTAFIEPAEMKAKGEILLVSTATYRECMERHSGKYTVVKQKTMNMSNNRSSDQRSEKNFRA